MLIVIPTDVLLLFISASLALALAPGPDNLFVLSQSALYGSRGGLLVTLGLCTGLLLHIAAATTGVAAIFQTSPLAFNLLKAVGAAYLVFWLFKHSKPVPPTWKLDRTRALTGANSIFAALS